MGNTISRSSRALMVLCGWLFMSSGAGAAGDVTAAQVDEAIRQLEVLAQKQIHDNAVPGLAIAVVFQDKLVYAKGFGVKDTRTNEPVAADTGFQLAAGSKSIGST